MSTDTKIRFSTVVTLVAAFGCVLAFLHGDGVATLLLGAGAVIVGLTTAAYYGEREDAIAEAMRRHPAGSGR